MLKKINSPILLICFNRPDLTLRVLDQIRKVKPKKLYIAIDGPRNKLDQEKISGVKSVIKTVNWTCIVKTKFQKKNLGCKYGPVTAMNWFFDNEKRGIILEDDVLADKSFFYFADQLLKQYASNEKVGSISGNNFQFGVKRGEGSFYFSRYSHSCGWATWRRAWRHYDVDISDYENVSKSTLNKVFDKWIDKIYWKLIFGGIRSGEIDSAWDYQWNWMMWKNNMLGIIPNVNLVENLGFGRKDATHTKFRSRFARQKTEPISFPLVVPKNITRNVEADNYVQKHNYVLWKEIAMNLFRKFSIIKRKTICRF